MIDHILGHPRNLSAAGMGLGKTTATMTALDTMYLAGDLTGPTLVAAPLRVASTTWPDEVQKWRHLRHLEVTTIIGDAKARRAALQRSLKHGYANIYTINYDNLTWLEETLKDMGVTWPFQKIVADECTKLKGLRVSQKTSSKGKEYITGQGSLRAKSLARFAFRHATHFTGLTGTPAPNGLKDLWGQMWFVDGGARLGRTYSAFLNRWFKQGFDGHSIEPLPFAQEQIEDAIRDVCLALDIRDYVDIQEPITTNIYVDLPAKARRIYDEMEKKMFATIGEHQVEAFSAAAKTMKCIAAGTEVLTSRGWKPIESWLPGDALWDGEEWVSADNLVCNGYMPVVKCFQVTMTSEHKVLTTAGWKTAQEVNNANASERFDRAPVRLPDDYRKSGDYDKHQAEKSNMDRSLHMRNRNNSHRPELDQPKPRRKKILRMPPWRNAIREMGVAWHDRASSLANMAEHEIPLHKSKRQRLAKLWCQGDYFVRALATVRRFLVGYGAHISGRFDAGTSGQRWGLRAEQLRMEEQDRPGQQSPHKYIFGYPKRKDDNCAGRAYLWDKASHFASEDTTWLENKSDVDTALVYDLVNCGPRNRFTVRGEDGKLLIVHNCLQIANGAAYVGESNEQWEEVHDAKLQALDDIIEEAAGMPVLVAYHFRSDLARLQKAFPKGRHLDKSPATIRDWNAGKIPVLFAHPASAGHGLNLQDGGNILVVWAHNWALEEYQQIIERIGPTRQLQAGHNRPMYLYHIIARDTIDEIVMARRDSKREVQDLLIEAMKKKGLK